MSKPHTLYFPYIILSILIPCGSGEIGPPKELIAAETMVECITRINEDMDSYISIDQGQNQSEEIRKIVKIYFGTLTDADRDLKALVGAYPKDKKLKKVADEFEISLKAFKKAWGIKTVNKRVVPAAVITGISAAVAAATLAEKLYKGGKFLIRKLKKMFKKKG